MSKKVSTSEWVSLGHPDKTCDYITSYILDKFLEKDEKVRYAVECMAKGNDIYLAGEVSSSYTPTQNDYIKFVKEALKEIGYNTKYHNAWGDNTIDIDTVTVHTNISKQSSNISIGVDNGGWGDQGIMFGLAENTGTHMNYMPTDYVIAKSIGETLYKLALENYTILGLDIKTMVTIEKEGDSETVRNIVIAIPMMNETTGKQLVMTSVRELLSGIAKNVDDVMEHIIINGTGKYIAHSTIADSGVTGRKLAVDTYGGNCKIGGGSMWGKDGTKSDVTLCLLARSLALQQLISIPGALKVETSLSCIIGKPNVVIYYKTYGLNNEIMEENEQVLNISPVQTAQVFGLNKPIFTKLCRNGFFSGISFRLSNNLYS